MNKIIFLDFDGVLNIEHYQGLLQYQGKPWQDEYGAFFDPKAVKQLKRIIDATDADIVVESSWKYLGLDAMKELWEVRNLQRNSLWLSKYAKQDIRYVIINDEYVILDSQLPHFILTNPYEGITEEQANRAISMLNE